MALAYTEEEFHIMVHQLLYQEPASFEMLCVIAQRTLQSSVYRWCAADPYLRGHEDDILQEIYLRLILRTVPSFLLREEGKVNLDPAGFRSWMFTVAKNRKQDYAIRLHKFRKHFESCEELVEEEAEEEQQPTDALLAAAVNVVLETDAGIYKTLTWLAQSVFMLQEGMTRIQANRALVDQFSQKDLRSLWELVLSGAQRISWLRITQEQRLRIEAALAEPYDAARSWGQVPYETFFMKKGGRASISDWVNRMDTMIKRVTQNETLNG